MFGNKSLPSCIYSYPASEPVAGRRDVLAQLRLAHRYRNDLIRLERDRRERVDAAVRDLVPAVADAEAWVARLEGAVAAKEAEIKARNAAARRRTATPEDRNALAALKAERKEAYAERKLARAAAFGDPARRKEVDDDIKKRLGFDGPLSRKRADREAREAAMERAIIGLDPETFSAAYGDRAVWQELRRIESGTAAGRRQLRAGSALYWGNYLAVEQAVDSMDGAAPPEFRRWTGDETIAVQLQGGLSVPDAMACRDTQLRIRVLDPAESRPRANPHSNRSRRRAERGDVRAVVSLRVGTAEDGRSPFWTEVPVCLHRPLPMEASIKWVHLHREIAGGPERWEDFGERVAEADAGTKSRPRYVVRWHVRFTLANEDGWDRADRIPARPDDGPIAGIDVGWRLVTDGLRVAYLVDEDDRREELIIPHEMLAMWRQSEDLQSIRDTAFDAARRRLSEWLAGAAAAGIEVPPWLAERTETLSRWKSPNNLAQLVWRWKQNRFEGDEEIFRELEGMHEARGWRQRDIHLGRWSPDLRSKAIRLRDQLYRRFAARVARTYATVRVEDTDWRELRRRPAAAASQEETNATAGTREYAGIAAVGTLLRFLREAVGEKGGKRARADGGGVEEIDAKDTTQRCHVCGTRQGFDAAANLVWTCLDCGAIWDQDENAARWLCRGGVAVGVAAGRER